MEAHMDKLPTTAVPLPCSPYLQLPLRSEVEARLQRSRTPLLIADSAHAWTGPYLDTAERDDY
jgi:hypothetical protein